jgi:8-oxo-dGTP diphosphatase
VFGGRRDGDGWVTCAQGHTHWGVFGAAGLLVVTPDGHVLLQHRAAWSHQGDTWGVPGGARTSAEKPHEAALREAHEETGLDIALLTVETEWVSDHGGWVYTTVVARAPRALEVHDRDRESTAVRWVPVAEVDSYALHPGFALAWPSLRDLV